MRVQQASTRSRLGRFAPEGLGLADRIELGVWEQCAKKA